MPTHPYVTRFVPLSLIDINPDQPRKVFDPADHEALKASILKHGLLTALALLDTGNGRFRIMGGERRFRVCREIHWEEIESKIWPADTPAVEQELIALVDNLQRKDLNAIETARGFQTLASPPYSLSQQAIADQLGIGDQATISRYLALLDMPEEIQQIMTRGIISEGHCRSLRKVTDKSAQIAIAKNADLEEWSVKETERNVQKWLKDMGKKGAKKKKIAPDADPYSDYWAGLKLSPELRAWGQWKVAYKSGTWSLELTPASASPMEGLVKWLGTAAPFLGQLWEMHNPQATSAPIDAAAGPTTEELLQSAAKMMPQRLPKTPEEQAELEALALQGPHPVYLWLFGPDHFLTQRMDHMSWADIGIEDPVTGVHDLVAAFARVNP